MFVEVDGDRMGRGADGLAESLATEQPEDQPVFPVFMTTIYDHTHDIPAPQPETYPEEDDAEIDDSWPQRLARESEVVLPPPLGTDGDAWLEGRRVISERVVTQRCFFGCLSLPVFV